jgi:PAS domain S-box-containing protein
MKAVIRNQDTMRKRAEEALSASEIRYRRLFETTKDGILILDGETGMIVDVNPFLVEMLGFSHEQFMGKRIWEIGFFKDIVKNKANFLELQQKEYIRYEDLPLETADGRRIDVEFISNIYRVGHQKVIQCNIRDITERKQAEKRAMADLERSNKDLEQFAYVASHDLQEPLRMVASYVQLLAKRYQDKLDADANEFIGYAVDGANRMQEMINDLLSYSRIETRGKPFETVDCTAILSQALTNLKIAIEETGAVITHNPLPTVMGDELQLIQLFQNLIGNAVKFRGKETPHIHISATHESRKTMDDGRETIGQLPTARLSPPKSQFSELKEGWVFSVRDNGIGIDPQHKERVFNVFQRLHGRDYSGTGIGLSICKRVVERYGGKIWVESEPAKGSTFYFTIPDRHS